MLRGTNGGQGFAQDLGEATILESVLVMQSFFLCRNDGLEPLASFAKCAAFERVLKTSGDLPPFERSRTGGC